MGAPGLLAVYELAAAEWGWKPRELQDELTDEQLVSLLDAAVDRISRRFDEKVEAVRAGTVVAHNREAFNRWRTAQRRRELHDKPALAGAELERVVMSLAVSNPDLVAVRL